jgi:hypothetical protein
MSIAIYDNFLPTAAFNHLVSTLTRHDFPWQEAAVLRDPPPDLPVAENRQLIHGFYLWSRQSKEESPWLPMLSPLLEAIGWEHRYFKIKANKTWRRPQPLQFGMHQDTQRPGARTLVYYLNSNNGYTLFAQGSRVMSIANRLALFDARLWHSGVACTDTAERLLININLLPGEGPLPAHPAAEACAATPIDTPLA